MNPNVLLSVVFDKVAEETVITIDTDFTIEGYNPALIRSTFYLIGPAGDLYINANFNSPSVTPDIDHSATNTVTLPVMPVDTSGNLLQGNYKLIHKLEIISGTGAGIYTYTYEETASIVSPIWDIEQEVDCLCATFTSSDLTSYSGTEVSYEHKINYPSETDLDDVLTGVKVWEDNKLANGTYVTQIATVRNETFGVFVFSCLFETRKSISVDCTGICEIKCSLNNLQEAYEDACSRGDKSGLERLGRKRADAFVFLDLMNLNRKCGQKSISDSYQVKLKALLGDCDCNCDDEDPIWVSNLCGSIGGPGNAFDFVFQAGGLITLTTGTVGTTKTINYSLSISQIAAALMATTDPTVIGLAATASFTLTFQTALDKIATLEATEIFKNSPNAPLLGLTPPNDEEQDYADAILQILYDLQNPVAGAPIAYSDSVSTVLNIDKSFLPTTNDIYEGDITIYLRPTIGGAGVAPGTSIATPNGGTAVVSAIDKKTITYSNPTAFVGNDVFYYTIINASLVESNVATVTVDVQAEVSPSCNIVTPGVVATPFEAANKLKLILVNLTDYNGNAPVSVNYQVTVYDISNSPLVVYGPIAGNGDNTPTIWTSVADIAATWDHIEIQITVDSSAGGSACLQVQTSIEYTISSLAVEINNKPIAIKGIYNITAADFTGTYTIASATELEQNGLFNFVGDVDESNTLELQSIASAAAPFSIFGSEGGTLNVTADGGFAYTPTALFSGKEYFDLKVVDDGVPAKESGFRVEFNVGNTNVDEAFVWTAVGAVATTDVNVTVSTPTDLYYLKVGNLLLIKGEINLITNGSYTPDKDIQGSFSIPTITPNVSLGVTSSEVVLVEDVASGDKVVAVMTYGPTGVLNIKRGDLSTDLWAASKEYECPINLSIRLTGVI